MTQIAGKVFVTINGQRLRSKEGASLETGGIEREAVISDSGVDGFMEKHTAPKVECKVSLTNDVRLADLQALKDGTLVFETDTGRTYTLINAWNAKPPKLEKGEVSLEFGAAECLEG
ncbi:MAG: phage tail tube protein [Burkholderiaceae bacterium]|nr:phage tail tube protein [Burkholderiaceae bacterium]